MSDIDYDVVVVGSGGAGNAAAIAASELGARVIILEAGDRLGGTTALSGGVFLAAGTSIQAARGINDSPAALFELYMAYNRWLLEPALVRAYCEGAAATIEWLIGLGVEYKPEALYNSSVGSIPRAHVPTGFGLELFNILHGRAASLGTEVVKNTRVSRLLLEGGRVVGVHADGADIRSTAVVLACGGLGAAPLAIQEQYYPDATQQGDWRYYIGAKTNRGDALTLGKDVDAVVAKNTINRGLVALTPLFDQVAEGGFMPLWLIFVNREGCRFMSEDVPYAVAGDIVNSQTDRTCFAIFDHEAFLKANGKSNFNADLPGAACPSWEHSVLARNLQGGRIASAGSLQALGALIKVNPAALATNVARYNSFVSSECDAQFARNMQGTVPLQKPPFYAAEVRAAMVPMTSVGLKIDVHGRVYDSTDSPIPGLYAAGEASGGVTGLYFGSGNGIGPPIVFGRLAGAHAGTLALHPT